MIEGVALAAIMIADLTAVTAVMMPNKQGWAGKARIEEVVRRSEVPRDRAYACLAYLQAHGHVACTTRVGNGGGTFWQWVKK